MFKLDYLIICENVIVDQRARISAINIFDNINVTNLPARHSGFHVLFRINPDKKSSTKGLNIRIAFRVIGPGQEVLVEGKAEMKDLSIKKGAGLASSADLSNTAFTKPGIHKVELELNGRILGEREFEVIKHAKQQPK